MTIFFGAAYPAIVPKKRPVRQLCRRKLPATHAETGKDDWRDAAAAAR